MANFTEGERALIVILAIAGIIFTGWVIGSGPEVICNQGICIEE